MSINHIAKFARGVVRASVSGYTDGITSGSARWNATRPLAVAVAAAALVSSGEAMQAQQFALFGIGQQAVVSQPRVVYVRKHHVAHHQHQRTSSKHASAPSDCAAIGKLDSEPQTIAGAQPLNLKESTPAEKTSSAETKKRAGHAGKRHVAGRSTSKKVASAKSDCSKVASIDSQPQKMANLERVDSTEPAAATETSLGDTKRHAAHEHKHKGKHRPRRLASSGKGAVKTTSCPGLARFLSAMPKTAKGPQIDPVETERRIADARQGVASDASDSVSSNDATEPTCSGVTASFYSDPQKTANGEQFDPNELTAAHRSLPFGTKLRVTNLATGQSVAVRINDRGPYIEGREIDLSEQAAASLGMLKHGLAKVKLDVVDELSCVQTDTGGGSWGGQSAFRLGGSESALAFFQTQ
jgi:rare lipoprotein A (peptidoglycan hydrolase)